MLADRTVDVWFAFCHHLLQNLVRENSGGTDLFTGERVIFYCYWQEEFCKILCGGVEHSPEKKRKLYRELFNGFNFNTLSDSVF